MKPEPRNLVLFVIKLKHNFQINCENYDIPCIEPNISETFPFVSHDNSSIILIKFFMNITMYKNNK